MLAAVIAEGVAIALLGLLVLGLLRSHALILRALHELGAGLDLERQAAEAEAAGPVGPVHVELDRTAPAVERVPAVASDVVGSTVDGADAIVTVGRAATIQRRRVLLAFLSSGCSVCDSFWRSLRAGVEVPGGADLAVVTRSADEESVSAIRAYAGQSINVVMSSGAWDQYGIPGSPYFVYLEDGRIVGEGSATAWPQVADLMAQALTDAAEQDRRLAVADTPSVVDLSQAGGDRDNATRIDAELASAGIRPGDPSLYHRPEAQ